MSLSGRGAVSRPRMGWWRLALGPERGESGAAPLGRVSRHKMYNTFGPITSLSDRVARGEETGLGPVFSAED